MTAINLVLASSSPSRRALLERLQVPFSCVSPEVNEDALPGEAIGDQVLRLAETKARAVAAQVGQALVIASDQLAELEGQRLGKPGNHEKAVQQLQVMSGRCVRFHTSICVLNTQSGDIQLESVVHDISYRELEAQQIEHYLIKEQPYQCAGSFKSEALGITLVERMDGPDPTALIGLPLITLTSMLLNQNYNIL